MIDSLEQIENPVEVITLWHVLEHIHQPADLLNNLKSCLTPEGYIIIAVPNRLSLDARVFRNNWVAYDAPRHLSHFRPEDMQSLLGSVGLQIINYRGLHFDPWYNSLLSVSLEARNKNSLEKLIVLTKGFTAAILSAIQGFLVQKKNSSVIYIAKPNQD